MDLTIEQRVAKGVDYMNTFGPADWRDIIDLEILDIDSLQHCILGQVFGEFGTGFYNNVGDMNAYESDYGFDGSPSEIHDLTSEWIRVLSLPATEQEEC